LNSKRVMLGSLWDVVLLTFGVLHLNGRVLHFNFKTVIRLVDLPCSAITLLCNYLALQLPRSSHAASAVGRSLSSHHRPTLFSTLQLRTDPTLHFVLSFFRPWCSWHKCRPALRWRTWWGLYTACPCISRTRRFCACNENILCYRRRTQCWCILENTWCKQLLKDVKSCLAFEMVAVWIVRSDLWVAGFGLWVCNEKAQLLELMTQFINEEGATFHIFCLKKERQKRFG
jgi:hypothetical protein